MQLYFFGGLANPIPQRVFSEVSQVVSDENIEIFPTVMKLSKRLRELDARPDIFVFVPLDHHELESLVGVQELVALVPLILVLPDQQASTVQSGHLLQPRFLTFGDCNLSEVSDVLKNIKNSCVSTCGTR